MPCAAAPEEELLPELLLLEPPELLELLLDPPLELLLELPPLLEAPLLDPLLEPLELLLLPPQALSAQAARMMRAGFFILGFS